MSQWLANIVEQIMDFSNILNASIAASWMVLAVIVLRLILKKVPRWTHVALWGLVAVRLLLPFSIESAFSLIPSTETVPQEILVYEGERLQDSAFLDIVTNPAFSEGITVEVGETVDRVQVSLVQMTPIWIVGMAALLVYTAVSYWRLRRKVSEAVILRDNIYQSENVGSPFVLGVFRPRIYLPYHMDGQNMSHVVAHEQAHICRRDHWWKPLGFLLLTIHWFNPLMWLAYVLLCRDIELACDEKVIKELGNEQRADYTQALVACSVGRRMIAACPLAFGEMGVKERVKSVMNYKKPAFWVVVLAVIACVVVAVCFLTNPKNYSEEIQVNGQIYLRQENEVETLPTGSYELGELRSILHRTKEHPSEDFSATNLDEKYAGNMLYQSGTDTSTIYLEDLSGFYIPFTVDESTPDKVTFEAEVLEIHDGYFLVAPEASWALNSADRIEVPMMNMDPALEPQIGDIIEIACSGEILETYPARLSKVYSIKVANVYHNKLLSVKIEEIGADESVEATYNYFDIAPFEGVTLPGMHTAMFSIDEVDEYVHISFEQPLYHNEQELRELQMRLGEMLHLTTAPDGGTAYTFSFVDKSDLSFAASVREWFNYLENPDEMNWSGRLEINLPAFPDVTFRWYPGKMEAVTEDGITPLYTGMPIWNTYFCDLTGDGLPELCSTYTFGSGMIDSRVIVYDYANGASYELSDCGKHDFTLRCDEESGRLWVDKKIYHSDELVSSGYLVFADGCLQVAENSSDSLDAAISNAILDHYRRDDSDGLIHVESHVLLANETVSGTPQLGADNHMEKTTVYLLVFHEKYSTYGGELESVGGSYVPAALTFTISDSGEYTLEEYWEPRDGGYYVDDVRDKFPGSSADDALNDQAYIEDLEAQNYNKALAYMNSTGSLDVRITALLDAICTSPETYPSGPDEYLEGHGAEYQELLSYGEYTLRYCFTEFLKGGQTDLRGQIMALACQNIMLAWGEGYAIDQDPITGQNWFDEFRSNAESLSRQYSDEDLEKYYPGSMLLLQLIDSARSAKATQN